MKFSTYAFLRMLKVAGAIVTAPLWFPLMLLSFAIATVGIWIIDAYIEWEQDYKRRERRKGRG